MQVSVFDVFSKINRSHSYRIQEKTSRNYYPILQQNVGCDFRMIREENRDHVTQMNINSKVDGTTVAFCLTGPCLTFVTG